MAATNYANELAEALSIRFDAEEVSEFFDGFAPLLSAEMLLDAIYGSSGDVAAGVMEQHV